MSGQVKTPDLEKEEPAECPGGKYEENDFRTSLSITSIIKIMII